MTNQVITAGETPEILENETPLPAGREISEDGEVIADDNDVEAEDEEVEETE